MSTTAIALAGKGLLQAVKSATLALGTANTDSYVSFTGTARVEPITILDRSLIHQEYITDVLQSVLSIFTGYYLQAVALKANVGNVAVQNTLGSLNPGAYVKGVSFESRKVSAESFLLPSAQVSMEADATTAKAVNEGSALSVGKVLDVQIFNEGKTTTIPVTVRLLTVPVHSDDLVHILTAKSENKSFNERLHRWKAGEISLWSDLILGRDLIDNYYKTGIKDKTGVLSATANRQLSNYANQAISGHASPSKNSNILVISSDAKAQLERQYLGKLSDVGTRGRIMNDTALMLIVVVDTEWERVTIYHRGISLPTEVSVKDMKASNKSGGADVSEILKAYQVGRSPSL